MTDAGFELPPMIQQAQLIEEIATGIAAGIKQPWAKLVYRANLVAPFMQDALNVVDPNGESSVIRIPRTFRFKAVHELRNVMYRPGTGTWYTLVLTITQPGDVDVDFEYNAEPEWAAPISPDYYATDQQEFPRDEASQPEWLKKQLALAAAQG